MNGRTRLRGKRDAAGSPLGAQPPSPAAQPIPTAISVFYVEREADIDVWRVLHGARDIPAWLREPLVD